MPKGKISWDSRLGKKRKKILCSKQKTDTIPRMPSVHRICMLGFFKKGKLRLKMGLRVLINWSEDKDFSESLVQSWGLCNERVRSQHWGDAVGENDFLSLLALKMEKAGQGPET